MAETIALVETLFELEKIDNNIYRAPTHIVHGGFTKSTRVFGGLVVSQALVSAQKTVPPGFTIHSLHCYFVRPGDTTKHILYVVDRSRDGTSFCTRYVKAIQDGLQIFTCELSFHKVIPNSYRYQITMPTVTPPELLDNTTELLRKLLSKSDITDDRRNRIRLRMESQPKALELRPVDSEIYLLQKRIQDGPKVYVWLRSNGKLGNDPLVHHSAAVFASDYAMIISAFLQLFLDGKREQHTASLDHSLWIHDHDYRMDEWMLHEVQCTAIGDDRAMTFGRLWTMDGRLAISTAQEGLIRVRAKL